MAEKSILDNSPEEAERLSSAMKYVLQKFQYEDDNMIPCRVVTFNRAQNIANVQPLVKWVKTDGNTANRFELQNIPVISMGAGNFHISFPIKAGDLGWLVAADRDISLFIQTLAENAPNTSRAHSFSDGLFIPDVLRQYTIAGEDADRMVIQHTSSNSRIAIAADLIKMTTPKVILDTPLTQCTGSVIIDQNLTVTGKSVLVDGATVKGIVVETHGHISSAPGVRTSGGMIA